MVDEIAKAMVRGNEMKGIERAINLDYEKKKNQKEIVDKIDGGKSEKHDNCVKYDNC